MSNKIVREEEKVQVPEKPKETSRLTNAMRRVADFDFNIPKDAMVKQIPFALFIVFLMLVHIWNAHNTEKVIRKTDKLNKEIKELRSEYISVLSALMGESRQSAVAQKLDTLGIRELTAPPFKITAGGNEH